MLLPVAVCLVLIFRGPPPYLLKVDRLGPEWADSTPHDFPDGTSVTVYSYPDEAAARQGAGAVLKAVPRSSSKSTSKSTTLHVLPIGTKNVVKAMQSSFDLFSGINSVGK
jgi:hypothetical protein